MKLKINIDGKQYEADIEVLEDEHVEGNANSAARPAPKRAAPTASAPAAFDANAAAPASDEKTCRSTIAGIVVQVFAAPGSKVAIGDKLLVLEAMKMESNVVSTVAGVVKAVPVAKGDSVKKGQTLVEFE